MKIKDIILEEDNKINNLIKEESSETDKLKNAVEKLYKVRNDGKYTYFESQGFPFRLSKKDDLYLLSNGWQDRSNIPMKFYTKKKTTDINEIYKYLIFKVLESYYSLPKNIDLIDIITQSGITKLPSKLKFSVGKYLENLGYEKDSKIFNDTLKSIFKKK